MLVPGQQNAGLYVASSTPVQGPSQSENPFSACSPEAGFPGGISALLLQFRSGFSGQYSQCDQYTPVLGQQNTSLYVASSTPVQGLSQSENPFSAHSPEAGFPGGISVLLFQFGSGLSQVRPILAEPVLQQTARWPLAGLIPFPMLPIHNTASGLSSSSMHAHFSQDLFHRHSRAACTCTVAHCAQWHAPTAARAHSSMHRHSTHTQQQHACAQQHACTALCMHGPM